MVARYLEVAGREYDSFDEFMKPDQVQSQLLNHHLKQLEAGIARIVGVEFFGG